MPAPTASSIAPALLENFMLFTVLLSVLGITRGKGCAGAAGKQSASTSEREPGLRRLTGSA
ncbi:hypothetical protein GCM10018790_26100 [Kitasatospora xanthocidica]|nr:hypothetical protein GCM10018790_26100 [Kitasatospora xanthocidica]